MNRTIYPKPQGEPKIIALKNRSWDGPGSLEDKSPAAEKKITGRKGTADEKEDHLTATYWG